MPDFLVFAAWYPHLTGVKIILDIHDIVPELYSSKFRSGKNLKTISLLKWMERRSARLADHVIISNDLWLEKYTSRTGTRDNSSVYINNVDNRLFQPNLRTRFDDKLIVLFPGGLQWHQGLDIALHAFVRVSRELPQAEFHIYGDGNMKTALIALTATLGLSDKVRFFEPLRITEIVRIMANADLGVVPKRADSFGNEAYSTKIMEFMSLGVPVVISRTKIDQFYFNDSVVKFFDSGNAEALADGMLLVLRDKALREQMITNASVYAARNSWESRKTDYLQLVDSLCSNSPTRVHAP
jgi:glycosyltransferase involved in cell wall biosynthesis